LSTASARDAGGVLAARAAAVHLSSIDTPSEIVVPAAIDLENWPRGPSYRREGRVAALLGGLIGPGEDDALYVGMTDRLPVLRRPRRAVMVAQNRHLYVPAGGRPIRQLLRQWLLGAWACWSARRADWIVVATPSTGEALIERTGVDRSRVVVRPIPPQDIDRCRWHHRDRLSRILLLGSLYDYKRFGWAVRALDRWAATLAWRPEVVHVGKAIERRAESDLIAAASDARHVDVELMGQLAHAEVIDELGRADLLVFPSVQESFGIPLAEALALGVPVVCTDIPAFVEVAGPDGAEYFGVDEDLTDALRRCESGEHRRDLAERGRARVEANGGWDVLSPPR
jgi:glycosyltransferase involved in cell wall biosynthesis